MWALVLEQDAVATVLEDNQEEEEAMVVKIYRASCEDTPNGPAYDYDPEDFSARMTFTNTYEKHEHNYDKKFDNKNHWDECACGDKQNTEAHKFSDWKVTKEATAATKGEKTRECTVCDYKETVEIPALKENPNTGDSMNIGFWLVLTLASGCTLTGVLRRRKHA